MSDDRLQQPSEVDGLLHRFAQLDPPEGMNDRVLARLRETERERALASRHIVGRWLVWPTTAVAAVVLATGALHWKQTSGPPAQAQFAGRFPSAPVEDKLVPQTAMRPGMAASPIVSLPGHHLPTEQLLWQIAAKGRDRASAVRHRYEQRAQDVSFPAPPAPLTEQEQLLVQVAEVRTPLQAAAEEPLLHREPAQVPGERLPDLPRDIPGKPLPTLAAETLGSPLPNFVQATKTGDQP